ncbi:AAA-like domain-containing protein [Acaryochloris sp. IP29b_bin.148]|uniref:AAA-like domain-containing protein n=1 Tax=Acaryochloris sp. IP29b_bin.148 TaxID=2969218 RepID=UPI00260E4703|nr:AAA-like domain-containing protein [Acaryochloris sp. IP29b_bin.148]
MKPQNWDSFLRQIAQDFRLTGKVKNIFLVRFAYENWRKQDKEVWPLAQAASHESYKKQMTSVYATFANADGCLELDSLSKGPGKFNILRDWLQETRYPEWLQSWPATSSPDLSICNYRTPLPAESPFYMDRPPIETDCMQAIQQPGALVRIKAPAQMGKTSLLRKVLSHASTADYQPVYLNFREAETSIFETLDKFLQWFCANICRELELPPQLDQYWAEELYGSLISCKTYIQTYLLPRIEVALVLGLDNVDRLFEYPHIAQDFLPMLRSWNEEATTQTSWQKIRLVIAHATEIYIELDAHQSPFNVGWPIKLSGFTVAQMQKLAHLYRINTQIETEAPNFLSRLESWIDGHPYLVHLTFDALRRQDIVMDELFHQTATQSSIYSDHLRGLWHTLQGQPQLATAMHRVVTADPDVPLEPTQAYQLESMGLIHLVGDRARPSCELYQQYFANLSLDPDEFNHASL